MVLLPGEILESGGVFNWQSHPLNGVLPTRASTLTDPAGLDFYRRWMRYVIARWEPSQAVNELRIATSFNSPDTAPFLKQIAEFLKELPRNADVPAVSQEPLTVPLEELGAIESFSSGEGSPLANWRADFRFGPSEFVVQPKAGGEQGGDCRRCSVARDPNSPHARRRRRLPIRAAAAALRGGWIDVRSVSATRTTPGFARRNAYLHRR